MGWLGRNVRRAPPTPPLTMGVAAAEEVAWRDEVAGSASAFGQLYEALAPRVYAFFMRSFRSPSLAEDLLQQTFLRAHKSRVSYRGEASPKAWLFAIAARVRIDELRRRMRSPTMVEEQLDELEAAGAGPPLPEANPAERAELREALAAAFERLPESQRVVLHLHRFEGLSFAEIGAILKTSEGAVRVRAFRALATLRELMEPFLGDDP